jgi:hypothetical protein
MPRLADARDRALAAASGESPTGPTEESTVHSSINYELMKARVADWQSEADRDQLARTAARTRRSGPRHRSGPVALTRRLLAAARAPLGRRPAV